KRVRRAQRQECRPPPVLRPREGRFPALPDARRSSCRASLELTRGLGRSGETRAVGPITRSRSLEVGDEAAFGALHYLDELPALFPPVVEDRGGVVDQQRGGQ